jgi:hypothetical protein
MYSPRIDSKCRREKTSRWSRQSWRTVRTQRSANALARGERTGVLTALMSMEARDAEQVYDAPFDLDGEEHVVAPQQHGVHGEEVGGHDALGLGAQELGPGRPSAPWGGAKAVGAEDVGNASLRHAGAELLQLADYPQVAPARVLPSEPHDQLDGLIR